MDSEDRFFPSFSQQSSDILKTCSRYPVCMHTLFSGKGKYSCRLTDCRLLAQLDRASPEPNFLSSGLRKTVCHDDVWSENFIHQNPVLCGIYTQMCVVWNTEDCFNFNSLNKLPKSDKELSASLEFLIHFVSDIFSFSSVLSVRSNRFI